MDVSRMILELRKELVRLDTAILALERLIADRPRRRGRPPALEFVAGGSKTSRSAHSARTNR